MKERPILFSGPMVRAILDGRKTMTRRIVGNKRTWWSDIIQDTEIVNGKEVSLGFEDAENGGWHKTESVCPYGQPGDRLWVKETHSFDAQVDKIRARVLSPGEPRYFHADGKILTTGCDMIQAGRKRPSIFMPRWASRITLEVVNVRVERLQDISEDDCDAEVFGGDFPHVVLPELFPDADKAGGLTIKECFRVLWESINGPHSWDQNPWVWVVEFKRIDDQRKEAA